MCLRNTAVVGFLIGSGVAGGYEEAIRILRKQLATRYRYLFLADEDVASYIEDGKLPAYIVGPKRNLFCEPTPEDVAKVTKTASANAEPQVLAQARVGMRGNRAVVIADIDGERIELEASSVREAFAKLADSVIKAKAKEGKDG